MLKRLIACIVIIVVATSLVGGFNVFANEAQTNDVAERTSCNCQCSNDSELAEEFGTILCFFFLALMVIALVLVLVFSIV